MGGIAGFTLITIVSILIIAAGVFLINLGKNNSSGQVNLKYIRIGWIMIGSLCVVLTIGGGILLYMSGGYSFFLLVLLLLSPLITLIMFIIFLCLGVTNLSDGYHKNNEGKRNVSKIRSGWVYLGIAIAIVFTVVVIIASIAGYFAAHPISLM